MAASGRQVGGRALSYLSVRRGRHLHLMKAATAQPNVMQATISRALDGSGLRAYMKYCILRRDP